jgi:murein DD-endopeptidase MepM/ murein hydrolase activator NlpD
MLKNIFIFGLLFILTGCATTVHKPEQVVISGEETLPKQGVYHKVKKGQTLWRIAKAYGIPVNEIIKSNNIPNVAQVEENQLIFIPGATVVKDIKVEIVDQNDFIWPIKGRIVQYFHDTQDGEPSKGINIEADEGKPVKASRGGEVVFADYLSGYGKTVIIDHHDGYATVYAHTSKLFVNVGDLVPQSKEIANVGDLAYLHFEVRKNSVGDNPLYYLP